MTLTTTLKCRLLHESREETRRAQEQAQEHIELANERGKKIEELQSAYAISDEKLHESFKA